MFPLEENTLTDKNKCYLCGSTEFKTRPGNVRDRPELEVLECVFCGLVCLSSFNHIRGSFYEDSQMHGPKALDIEAWLKKTDWDDNRRFQYLKSKLPNRSLLDFGCGAGGFLLKAKELAAVVYGVELETHLSNYYQGCGLTVFQRLSDIPNDISRDGYDIITMFHVLEHIPDPKSILSELSEMLASDGQMILEVPNANDVLLTLYQCEAFSHFTYWGCHLFLYTVKTLEMLFSQINLKVNYIKQIQRYPISNHLYWLANGKPGGHERWHFLDSPELHCAYEKQLAAIGNCDTILASVSR